MAQNADRCRPFLIVEVEEYCLRRFGTSVPELLDLIRGFGYEVLFLEYHYPSDHLCVPRELLEEFIRRFGDRISEHTVSNPINDLVAWGVCRKISFSSP